MQEVQALHGLVPLLSTQAGSCLTYANWQDAHTKMVSYRIADLLMKPGLSFLHNLADIRSYCTWPGSIVLNAVLLPPNADDTYTIRSIYDGSLIQVDVSTLFELINKLRPDKVILPQASINYFTNFWQNLSPDIMPYFHVSENPGYAPHKIGRYVVFDPQLPFSLLVDQINSSAEPLYIKGDFNLIEMAQLASCKKHLIESDRPAKDGLEGIVYSREGQLNIVDKDKRDEHFVIDESCQCNTCKSNLTRAYLHHLLEHTPLLAQRYLIQHNIYYCQTHLHAHL
ncbi:MAG: queuine tRNA-ribosyltransferase [Legionella sp.]|nr:queuine tRNA-ribosyltransferase [Legionella sp.]